MQIFVVGTGRSGTSIFNRIIGLHSQIWSFRWESQIFAGLPALVDLVDTKSPKLLIAKFIERAMNHLYKRNVNGKYYAGLFEIISYKEFKTNLEQLRLGVQNSKSERDRIMACAKFSDSIFLNACVREGKNIWCEKTPRNLLYADKIQKIYPEAKFINIVRDGREVVSSIMEKRFWPIAKSSRFEETMKFGGDVTLQSAVDYWCTLMDITETMKARVGLSSWLDVRLEDLGRNLESVQTGLEDFLRIDRDNNFSHAAKEIVDYTKTDRKRWKECKTMSDIVYMKNSMKTYLDKYGY